MRFVIIGGDAAGMSAASRAGRLQPDTEIIVFEQTEDVSYSACGMPYNIANPDSPVEDLVVRSAKVFREKQGVDLRTGHRVTAIDRDKKIVTGETADGNTFECNYDALLIATGASPIIPGIPGIESEGVLPLKKLDDGRKLKEHLATHTVTKAVIIGMGYIALEMADSLRSRGIDVTMVKPRKRLLPWLNEKLSNVVHEELVQNGVEVHSGHTINSINKTSSGLTVHCDDHDIECQLVIPAIGVKPNSELAMDAGLETSVHNAISVNRHTRTSDPDIYSAGDCADACHVVTGTKTWVPLAVQANRAGRAVADNLFGEGLVLQGIAGSAMFRVFGLEVSRTGLNPDEARKHGFDPVEITIESRSRAHAHPGSSTIHVAMVGDKKTGRLLGAQMAGREGAAHRIHAVAVALHAGMTVADFWQTDLAYAPPFSPVWDPLLTAANQLSKKVN
ncbi:MAG: FAD-dependent oxidoreductase [Spirochaetota bacterium]